MSASTYSIGIDCGSSLCKGVVREAGKIRAMAVRATGWDIPATGRQILAELFDGCPGAIGDASVVATGYGREKIPAERTVTEITCHARGAEHLFPGVRCVIDIGGQDSKVIETEGGKVLSFHMNDKCAAGSGRFLEMILARLELDLPRMDALLSLNRSIALNSTCVVFAESEIIGLLARGVSREEILGGVVNSMVTKISSQAARVGVADPVVLTGGLSSSHEIGRALSKALGRRVESAPDGIFAGAIGAAFLALDG
jgi:predicted CoA-substrate-specific enzyme activase